MFGDILHDVLINNPHYSISAFAKDIGISAGLLNHIFNGKRTIAADKFALTIANSAFSSEEKQRLKDGYFSDRYGEEMYSYIRIFHNSVQSLDFDNNYAVTCEGADFSKEISVFEDEKTFICAIKKIFRESKDCVYTNIPHKKDKINNILFSLKKEYAETQFCRIITGFDDSFSEESLTAMFSIIRFARLGVPTVSLDNKDVLSLYGSTIFPYYIISDKALILTDGKFSSGIIVFSQSVLSEKYLGVKRKFSSCKQAVNLFDSQIEMTNYLISNEGNGVCSLGYYPCLVAQDDLGFLEDVLALSDSDKHEVVKYVKDRLHQKKWSAFTSLDGLWEFLHQDKSYVLSEEKKVKMSLEAKVSFLESLIYTIRNSKYYTHNYLKADCRFSLFVKELNIRLDDEMLVITTTYDKSTPDAFMGQVCLSVNKGEMYRTVFLYLNDYLPASGEIISDNAAIDAITAMIIECKAKQ